MFDDNMVIPVFRTRKHASPLLTQSMENNARSNKFEAMANKLLNSTGYSEFVQNVLYYICVFIVTKLIKKVKCSSCLSDLTGPLVKPIRSDHNYFEQTDHHVGEHAHNTSFIHFINNGNLKLLLKFVVVKYAEQLFKLHVTNQPNQITKQKNLKTKMVMELCAHFGQVATTLLPPRHEDMLNEALLKNDHILWLLKCVADSYLKIRLSTYRKILW